MLNIVNEYYFCVMYVKYEFLEIVIKKKFFKIRYVFWVDIGYFREEMNKLFRMEFLDNLKEGYIVYIQIYLFYDYMQSEDIIKFNSVWIVGGFIFGILEYFMIMIEDYKKIIEDMIFKRLMDID